MIVAGDTLHMFATYKASAEPPWGGNGVIRHSVAPLDDPIDGWTLADVPSFNQPDPIDVSLLPIGDEYRAYDRVGKNGGIQWATSSDLIHWDNQGQCPGELNAKDRGFGYQEAPYVFKFQDRYWMLTDPHDGLAVFHSPDGVTWTQQDRILREPGTGAADATLARHPRVASRPRLGTAPLAHSHHDRRQRHPVVFTHPISTSALPSAWRRRRRRRAWVVPSAVMREERSTLGMPVVWGQRATAEASTGG